MSASDLRPPWRALLATSDKRGLAAFSAALHRWGWTLIATSGSAALLRGAGLPVTDAETLADAPPLLGGRLKTLTLRVFGSLLMRTGYGPDEEDAMRWRFSPIHMLVGGFYPIAEDEAEPGGGDDWIERIDIGGPAMLRAAAKNHKFVVPLVTPDDFDVVLAALAVSAGDPAGLSAGLRRRLARDAFDYALRYDQIITRRLSKP